MRNTITSLLHAKAAIFLETRVISHEDDSTFKPFIAAQQITAAHRLPRHCLDPRRLRSIKITISLYFQSQYGRDPTLYYASSASLK
jgi:hypothetical protein